MVGSRRERELARAHYERQQAKRAAARARTRRRNQILSAALAVVLVIGGVAFLSQVMGDENPPAAAPADSDATPSAEPSPSEIETTAAGTCRFRDEQTLDPETVTDVGIPPREPRRGQFTAKVVTNRGTVKMDLLPGAPCTTTSFRFLAGKDYFDDTTCHRLTTGGIKVLQCGDPTGTGRGGPGYSFPDENLAGATYPAGTVAMANSGPNTNGSQFFFVYEDSTGGLSPAYTPFAQVTSGLDVLTAIAETGVEGGGEDGAPAKKVVVEDVVVTKKG